MRTSDDAIAFKSYFIHNGALSIMRNAKQETNARDLWLAFLLVCGTYAVVAVCFYMSYVSEKSEIEQNFLQNFASTDSNYIFALIAECFLLMQMITVFPLLLYIVRFQVSMRAQSHTRNAGSVFVLSVLFTFLTSVAEVPMRCVVLC